MSYLREVRPYFRTRLKALGFREWSDGFNFENIPRSLLTRSFHLESGEATPTASDHQVHEFLSQVTVRIFLNGYRDPASAIDDAWELAEDVLAGTLLPSVRLQQSCIKDVEPGAISVSPVAASNDNAVILEMNFAVLTFNKF